MANSLLKWGLVIGGGYLAYKAGIFNSILAGILPASTAPATTPPVTTPTGTSTSTSTTSSSPTGGGGSTGSAPPAPPPAYTYVPPGTAQLLQQSAGPGVTTLNADQWNYYYQRLPGKSSVPDDVFTALFFPNGRPADPSQNPQMSAADFVAAITTKGLSGLGRIGVNRRAPLDPRLVNTLMRGAQNGELLSAIYLLRVGMKPAGVRQAVARGARMRGMPTGGGSPLRLSGIPLGAFRF